MKQSGSDNSAKEALDAHKTALDEKKKSASRKMADEKRKQSSKYLAYFQETNDILQAIYATEMDIYDTQVSMSRSMSEMSKGISSINKILKKGLGGVAISRATAKEMKDTSLFDESDLQNQALEGFVSMSENMSDTMDDFYSSVKPSKEGSKLDNFGNKIDSAVDAVLNIADDIDDFEPEEFRMVEDGPQVMSDTQADRLRDIEDMHKDILYANVANIDKNVAAISKYYSDLKNKKTGKTGNPTEEEYEKKDKGFSLTDMLLGWLGLKKLKDLIGKGMFAKFGKKLSGFLTGLFGKKTIELTKELLSWPFRYLKTNAKLLYKRAAKGISKYAASFAAGMFMQAKLILDPLKPLLDKLIVAPIKKVSDLLSGLVKKSGSGKMVAWLTDKFKLISGFISKLLPSSLTGIISKLVKHVSKALPKALSKFAGGAVMFVGKFFGAVLFMAWDAISGFTDEAAAENLGIKKEAVGIIDKIHSSVLSILSGLTFSLVDAKTIGEMTGKMADLVWVYITEPVIKFFEKVGESISKIMDDFASMIPQSLKDFGSKFTGLFSGDEEIKPKSGYENSPAYLAKRRMQYTGQIDNAPAAQKALAGNVTNISKAKATPIAQTVNTATAKTTDKQAAEARKKVEPVKPANNVVVNNNSTSGGQPTVSRSISSGRSDISRSIGRGSQFNF